MTENSMTAAALPQVFFLTWIEHRRTRELSRRLGIELVELVSKQRGVRRYLELIPRTLAFLRTHKPRCLVIQSPSLVLAAVAVLLRPYFGYRVVMDAHNEAVEPFLNPFVAIRVVADWLIRKADRVIVTNQGLAEVIIRKKGRPLILCDPLPAVPAVPSRPPDGTFQVVVVSTYSSDEPFEAVVAAARALPEDVRFFVTGNPAKVPESLRAQIPSNMTLTGFLSEERYWSTLASSDVVMDLTVMDNCLVCGAYEAIALSRPIVVSDNAASRDLFSGFGEFADNTPAGLASALARVRKQHAAIISEFPRLRTEFERRWSERALLIRSFLGNLPD